jgi:hypothetical protein
VNTGVVIGIFSDEELLPNMYLEMTKTNLIKFTTHNEYYCNKRKHLIKPSKSGYITRAPIVPNKNII